MSTALEWAMRNAWAMEPSYLRKMVGVLFRHAMGTKLSAEEIAAVKVRGFGASEDDDERGYDLNDGVATVRCYGVIGKRASSVNNISGPRGTSCEELRANIEAALNDPKCKSLVLDTDSPGGSVDGVADLSDFIFNSRGKKPMTAFANGQMCSAAYFIASACDKIVASQDASVGSIGVYSILQDWSKYLQDMGVNEEMIKAGKYKGLGHPDFPITNDTRKIAQDEVNAHYGNFVNAIARNRGMSVADATKVADGRHHVGAEAVKLGLADSVGTLNGTVGSQRSGSSAKAMIVTKPSISEETYESAAIAIDPKHLPKVESFLASLDAETEEENSRLGGRGETGEDENMDLKDVKAAGAEKKIVSIFDANVEDIKASNPELYERIGRDYARAERERQDNIKTLIAESGCDKQLADTLFVACKDMGKKDAKIEINRVCGIEASLRAAKIAGLDDDDLKHLRADVKDLPQLTAVRHIEGFVNAKAGAKARLVNTPDKATTGADKPKEEAPKTTTLKEAVAKAKAEYADPKNLMGDIMGNNLKGYVEQYLQDNKIEATDEELKAIEPDLFK